MGLFNKIFKQKNLDNDGVSESKNDLNDPLAKVKYNPIIIELIPKVGIPPITFGTSRETVRQIMMDQYAEQPSPRSKGPDTDAYFDGCLQFFFEKDQTLSFIECWNSNRRTHAIKILDFNTWEVSGKELLEGLKAIDKIDISISDEDEPIFMDNIIALWGLDEQYDHFDNWKTPKWGAIGIGDDRYYQAIREIHNRSR